MNRRPATPFLMPALLCITLFCGCSGTADNRSGAADAIGGGWRTILDSELPVLGHRNWIAIVDSAYPKQSAEGIETVATSESQLDVLDYVVRKIGEAPHVKGVFMRDAELDSMTDQDTPGVEDYRAKMKALLEGERSLSMPHEEIIAKLDRSAEMFDVLVLKSTMTLPYTSVFIELDCGYWDTERERQRVERNQRQ